MVAYLVRLNLSTLSIVYGILCVSWACVVRFLFASHSTSAYAAILGFFMGVTLWIECAFPTKGTRLFTCYTSNNCVALTLKILYCTVYSLLFITGCVLSVLLNLLFLDADFDLIASAIVFAFGSCLLCGKIYVTRQLHRMSDGTLDDSLQKEKDLKKETESRATNDLQNVMLRAKRRRLRRTRLWHIINSVLVTVCKTIHVLLLVGIVAGLACTLLAASHKPVSHLESVHLGGSSPVKMYFRCLGNGTTTVVIGSDWARLADMASPFVPKLLTESAPTSKNVTFRVCIYDPFGYGWSDSLETNHMVFDKESQAMLNVKALKLLADRGVIGRPFIFVGYGLSSLLVDCFAAHYQEYLRGVVFINWYSLVKSKSIMQDGKSYLAFLMWWTDLLPLGWVKLHWSIEKPSMEWLLRYSFPEVPSEIIDALRPTFIIGDTFKAAVREGSAWYDLGVDSFCKNNSLGISAADHALYRAQGTPLLVLDRDKEVIKIHDLAVANGLQKRLRVKALRHRKSNDALAYTREGGKEVVENVMDFVLSLL